MTDPAGTPLRPALEAVTPWLSRPNIVGLGLGPKVTGGRPTGTQAVLVFVARKQPADTVEFPVPPTVSVDGTGPDGRPGTVEVPTDVQETGPMRAEVLDQRVRPVPGGYQIQATNMGGGTGTLGVNIVWAGRYRAMSNNHVLAVNGDLRAGVYQPDRAHDDGIGTVSGYTPVTVYASDTEEDPTYNRQDLAWVDVTRQIGDPEIHRIGTPTGLRAPVAGEQVTLIGKQTGTVQTASVADILTKAVVVFAPRSARPYAFFEQLIRLDRRCTQSGDSGSAYVATKDRKVVGLHVGASDAFSFGCQLWPY